MLVRLGHYRFKTMFKALKTSTKIVFGIILLLIVLRLALPSLVKNYVNKQLNELPGYTGHVDDIDISLWRGAYAIDRLLLKKRADTGKYPFLQIAHCDFGDRVEVGMEREAGKRDCAGPASYIYIKGNR